MTSYHRVFIFKEKNMKITKQKLQQIIKEELSKVLKENITVEDLTNQEISQLTMRTSEEYNEQFENELIKLLELLYPEISEEAKSKIIVKSSELQNDLKSLVNREHSAITAGRKFLNQLVNFSTS